MNVFIAKHSGFCYGVKEAVDQAIELVRSNQDKLPIYNLGNLVHNSYVVDDFRKKGVQVVKDLDEIKTKGYLIISAHGVPPQILKKAQEKGLVVVDTTCIHVVRVQKIVSNMKAKGAQIIIIGDEGHPEVVGIRQWAGENAVVINKPEDCENMQFNKKVVVVSQTTQSKENFNNIVDKISANKSIEDLEVVNTICGATSARQNSAKELAEKVDLMLVIGDYKSSNTKKLAELSKAIQPHTHLIQSVKELDPVWLQGVNNVGVTAGASTPDFIVEEVVGFVKSF